MEISSSIDIKCSPATAFGWIEKPEKTMVWMSSVSKAEILHETADRVGTTFRETMEEDGNALEILGAITGFEPGRSVSFHLDSKVNTLDVKYSVEPIPGGVRVAECAAVRWKFPINVYSIFFGKKIRDGILMQLHQEFGRLKALCEEEFHAPN